MRASTITLLACMSLGALAACGDDDEVAPPDTSIPPRPDTGPAEDSGPRDTGPRDAEADLGPELDTGPRDAGPDVPDADTGPPDPDAGCEETSGCWSCPPSEPLHFLNQCTSSDCAAFDNEERLPLYTGPTLPPLP